MAELPTLLNGVEGAPFICMNGEDLVSLGNITAVRRVGSVLKLGHNNGSESVYKYDTSASAIGVLAALTALLTAGMGTGLLVDEIGGNWQLVVDSAGNLGASTAQAELPPAVVLEDEAGGNWKVVVDAAGNLGAEKV